MSVFSQKLQALIQPRIDKGQLTIYGLARNSKIDRSSLYKFINGERLASTEILSRLVDAPANASLRTEGCLRYFTHGGGALPTQAPHA
ncbi:MAG: helix-turn-helix domain-containing protein [Anaeromassilibacillus sp.]